MSNYENIINLIESYSKVELFYLFGSRATEKEVPPGADWDFACPFSRDLSLVDAQFLGFEIQAKLSGLLKTDAVDLVVLNGIRSVELAHAIVSDGERLIDRHIDSDRFERHIRHEYEDHKSALRRNGFVE